MPQTLSRRNFFGTAAAAAALPAAGALSAFAPVAMAASRATSPRTLEEIRSMSPVQMARQSQPVQAAYRLLLTAAGTLRSGELRTAVIGMLKDPVPTIAQTDARKITEQLIARGFCSPGTTNVFPENADPTFSPQPFWSAPGSGWTSHHAYPGGLATHVAYNVAVAMKMADTYASVSGLVVDRDTAVGAEILHDLHKPLVFQWQADGTCRTERKLAKTGEHHVLSLAESMKRGLPAELVTAQACAHEHPGTAAGEALVVGWIECAAAIAGLDPEEEGYLAPGRRTLPLPRRTEGWLVHLADHDFVLSSPACRWSAEALEKLAQETYGIRDKTGQVALRNYALCNLTAMRLYGILSARGRTAFAREVARLIKA